MTITVYKSFTFLILHNKIKQYYLIILRVEKSYSLLSMYLFATEDGFKTKNKVKYHKRY